MNKKLIEWWAGGSSVTAEYQAVLDRATALGYTHPGASVKAAQNALIRDLKAAGIWTNLDVFYVFANDVSGNFWKLNWVTPASFACTEPGGAVTKSNAGIKGNGTSTYADCNFTPSTQAIKMTTSSGSQALYLHTVPATGTYLCGARNVGGANPYLHFRYTNASSFDYFIMGASMGGTYTGGTPSGSFLYGATIGSGGGDLFKDGVNVNSSGSGSPALAANSLRVGSAAGNAGGFSDALISFYCVGAKLTGLELSLYNAWNTYKTAIGL